MIHLIPGDPVRGALGMTAPPALVESTREALGLNDPLWVQYVDYLRGLLSGDLGTSMITKTPVSQTSSPSACPRRWRWRSWRSWWRWRWRSRWA